MDQHNIKLPSNTHLQHKNVDNITFELSLSEIDYWGILTDFDRIILLAYIICEEDNYKYIKKSVTIRNEYTEINIPRTAYEPEYKSYKLEKINIRHICLIRLNRFVSLVFYLNDVKEIDMDENKMRILLEHMYDIDKNLTMDLYHKINDQPLIELFAQSFMKLDLRLPVEKILTSPSAPSVNGELCGTTELEWNCATCNNSKDLYSKIPPAPLYDDLESGYTE